ncbi:phosphonate metabolism transcriptional regulator PhnF [Dokdonella soli]|uniref:Phosphonate metabolism transcriptional regulator PhnF n=1 Tax=Dokdonella soli TaxID=529810 RepID=A0ABN1IQW2_9GAMM
MTIRVAKVQMRNASQPLWRQIEHDLLKRIQAGELRRGERLPSALALARDLGANRHTVRRALAALEQRGLLRTELGRGSFVCEESYDYPIGRRTRFTQNMSRLNVEGGNDVLATGIVTPPPRIAKALALLPGECAWRTESAACAEGKVLDHCEAYFPLKRFAKLDQVFLRTRSVTRTLAEFGITDYFRRYTKVSASLPGEATARVLGQAARRPVLVVESLNVDTQGVPVQYGLTRFAGERVQLVLTTDD